MGFFGLGSGLLGLALAFAPAGARAAATLEQVCGPKGSRLADSQADQLCRAAYANGEAWIANDNNSRIWAPVAIVCGYTCVVGLGSSCSSGGAGGSSAGNAAAFDQQLRTIGTGGSPGEVGGGSGGSGGSGACGTAVHAGQSAYQSDKASNSDLDAAKRNGSKALGLQGGKGPNLAAASKRGSSGEGASASEGGYSIPDSCVRAGKGGAVQDRIDCAVATDPRIPPFVKTPEFQQEFQRITGKSLQEVINKSPSTIMNRYASDGLKHAFQGASGKVSFDQFLKGGAGLLKAMASGLGSEDRVAFLKNALPPSLAGLANGLLDGIGLGAEKALASVAAPSGVAEAAQAQKTLLELPSRDLSQPAFTAGAEEDRSVSLFARVSARYRATRDRVEKLDWALRMNQD